MEHKFTMSLSLNVLNHLGINLYSNVPAVLSEIVANSWDADAENVTIAISSDEIIIEDNGCGMTVSDINSHFLKVGYQKREDETASSKFKRRFMGRKGIGKLSMFSIAREVDVISRKTVGGVIESNALRMNIDKIADSIKNENINAERDYHPDVITEGYTPLEKDGTRIDTALAERPADLDEFLNLMKQAGYEVKTVRGGGISFRLTGQGQERFTRLRASTLGDGYDLQDVLSAIEGKEKRPGRSERKISLAVDIQAKLAAGKGPGYERWAKVFNIKQMAAALAYIQDNGLTDYEQLAQKATEAADRFHAISEQIKQTEQAMKTNAGLKAATVQYAKTRPVFEQYKATKYSRKFLAEHEADLELYRAAQTEMRSLLGGAKLPKMDVLKEEGRKLTAKKKQLYGEYQKARRDMQEIVTIKANIDTLMGYTEPGRKQEKER